MSDTFRIGLIQDSAGDDLGKNLADSIERVRAAAKQGAQIICLKELFCSRYFCTVESADRCDLAEPADGKTVTTMAKLAKELGVVIVIPFFERRGPGVYHNSVAVADADGSILGLYRKMHIPDDPLYYEKYYFTPGDVEKNTGNGFRVFKTKFATIGVLICWDQWYPEGARITSLLGAEVLFYPTAIGWHPREKAEFGEAQRSAWQTMQRAHAISNGVFVAAVNRVGHEPTPGTDGIEFFGNSFISDPFGRMLTEDVAQKDTILLADCSRKLMEEVRRNWPFLRDRRIDAYGPILNRYLG